MAQVIGNLLINAAKYTEPGGRIDVEAGCEGGQVILRVRDNGAGIAPELLPYVFDAFVQGERAPDRGQGGLGIGLAIAKSLLEGHGGEISAWSDGRGQGSEFVVRLPVAHGVSEPAASSSAVVHPATDGGAGERGRVLVVDDNRDAADALAEALRALGYVVEVAYDGPSALTMVGSFQPDAALLDIGLPAMDGYEVAAKLRRQPKFALLRLIAVTGYGQAVDRARARSAGFDAHLVKPVALATVSSVLHPKAGAGWDAPPRGRLAPSFPAPPPGGLECESLPSAQ
jgi:CheY-like chemotaxis protein